MGMDVGGKKGGPKSDINVTPLVDVVLVLLIVFMVAMPIMMRQITIEIPRKMEKTVEFDPKAGEQITLEMGADGRVLMRVGASEEPGLSVLDLPNKLKSALRKKTGDKVVFVDFDYEVAYGNVVTMMDVVKGAGAEKVALVDKSAKQSGQ